MFKVHLLLALSTLILAEGAHARVIYGRDNRKEVSEGTSLQKRLARSAATMVAKSEISASKNRPGYIQLTQTTLRDWLEDQLNGSKARREKLFSEKVLEAANAGVTFCEGERFVDQPNPGTCSGFLIADDLILTAGHCVKFSNFCSDYKWVFGFEVNPKTKKAGLDIPETDVYSCKKVISKTLSYQLSLDYALVQLDRPVKDRLPLNLRVESQIQVDTPLFVIGSPSGLPLKIADGAKVRSSSHPFYFTANLDTFQGNSGSAVFNARTGEVEGILVRGESDYVPNMNKMCVEANKCSDHSCRGEDVTRLTAVPELGVHEALSTAAETGDALTVQNILKLNVWVDFYTKSKETALTKAAKGAQARIINILIKKGANVNHQDANGETPLHHLARVLNEHNQSALKELLSAKADPRIRNIYGQTALDLAKKLNPAGVEILQKNGI